MTIEIHMSGIKLTECKIFKSSAFIILPRPMTFYLLLAWLVVNENEVRFSYQLLMILCNTETECKPN